MKMKIAFIAGLLIFLIVGIGGGWFFINLFQKNGSTQKIETRDLVSMKQEYLFGSKSLGNVSALESEAQKKNAFEVYSLGFNEPVAIAFWKYDYFIGSRKDKALYQMKGQEKIPLAPGDFISDMVIDDDGSVIATIFNENRLIQINPKGIVKPISNNVSNPTGIAWSPGGCYFVSNYSSGTISCVESGGKTTDILTGLMGPTGLLIHNKTLYVADFLSQKASVLSIPINKIGKEKMTVNVKNLVHASGIGFVDGVMYVIHTNDGIGVVSRIESGGNAVLTAVSGLPDPVFGKFSPDRYVYMVSPNDPDGNVMRMRFEI